MKSKKGLFRQISDICKYAVKILKMMVKKHKFITMLWMLLTVGVSIFPSINVFLSKVSIDNINNISSDKKYLKISIVILLLIALTNVTLTLLDGLIRFLYTRIKKDVDYNIQKMLYSKLKDMPIEKFEDSIFYNNLSLAQTAIYRNCLDIVKYLFGIIQNIITISSVIYILFSVHWSLPIALFLSTLPGIIILFIAKAMRYRMNLDTSQTNREMNYTSSLFFNRYIIKEIKLFNIGDFLIQKWSKLFTNILTINMNITAKEEKIKILGALILQLSNVFISIYLLTKIGSDQITLGSYVSLTAAVSIVQSSLASLGGNLGEVFEISLYTKALLDIIDDDIIVNEMDKRTILINKIEDIEILGLTFKYPGSERSVLNNINLSIKKGEKIAIVGNNGAGKTTLINIILGLYTKHTGNILINNTEFGKIELNSYNKRVSAILQDFIRYNYSLNENIIMGDVAKKDNYDIVEEIICQVGLSKKVEKLKYGVNTKLSKEYEGGEDLSGGEWQKLAIARAMIKDSDLIVLDEPTSALDPIAELEIFELFNKISQGKTTIMISHRLGITRFADKIIVLQNGEIAETGSHIELMQLGGVYKNMYLAQANWYK